MRELQISSMFAEQAARPEVAYFIETNAGYPNSVLDITVDWAGRLISFDESLDTARHHALLREATGLICDPEAGYQAIRLIAGTRPLTRAEAGALIDALTSLIEVEADISVRKDGLHAEHG